MLPKYIIRLNYYDRVSTAKAFHDTPNNKSALLLQRECQTPKSYVIICSNKPKKEKKEEEENYWDVHY